MARTDSYKIYITLKIHIYTLIEQLSYVIYDCSVTNNDPAFSALKFYKKKIASDRKLSKLLVMHQYHFSPANPIPILFR